jgi:hypothetical protein
MEQEIIFSHWIMGRWDYFWTWTNLPNKTFLIKWVEAGQVRVYSEKTLELRITGLDTWFPKH